MKILLLMILCSLSMNAEAMSLEGAGFFGIWEAENCKTIYSFFDPTKEAAVEKYNTPLVYWISPIIDETGNVQEGFDVSLQEGDKEELFLFSTTDQVIERNNPNIGNANTHKTMVSKKHTETYTSVGQLNKFLDKSRFGVFLDSLEIVNGKELAYKRQGVTANGSSAPDYAWSFECRLVRRL